MKANLTKVTNRKLIIRRCHCCDQVVESEVEQESCLKCGKAFLPLNYFDKIHGDQSQNFKDLFAHSDDLQEEDLITGIYVLW
jgi:hypothetical protein